MRNQFFTNIIESKSNDEQLNENLETLKAISKLEKNWNFHGADSFPGEFIRWVRIILMSIDIQPEVFPTGADSIEFVWENNDDYLAVALFFDKHITLSYVSGNSETSFDIHTDTIKPENISELVDIFYYDAKELTHYV